jgi:hypothetical protein
VLRRELHAGVAPALGEARVLRLRKIVSRVCVGALSSHLPGEVLDVDLAVERVQDVRAGSYAS